jgi:hypothetical protein
MTKEEEAHIKRMVVFAKRQAKNLNKREPLTPEELANAITELKKKYPDHFPVKQRSQAGPPR